MTGNTILVTGGTSGIGLGLARRFAGSGNTVIVAGRRKDRLDEIVAGQEGIEAQVLDVADPASIATCFEQVTARHPGLNVLVNNAGIMQPEDLADPAHLAVAEAIVTTNLLGPIRVLTAFLPFLLDRPDAVVMNVSSGLAFVPLPMTPTYCATKAAVHSLTQSLRVQVGDRGVEVLELVPPAVQTDLMGQNDSPRAMPLEAFLSEVMAILAEGTPRGEICVETVKRLRDAEADGTYDSVLRMLSGAH